MPGWWMGAPWTVKKYMDDVFTEGHGSLYASDGRTRSDASKKYGSGGLVQGSDIPWDIRHFNHVVGDKGWQCLHAEELIGFMERQVNAVNADAGEELGFVGD